MLIIPPYHSVTSPTVGVGYLKTAMQNSGIPCPAVDLNISLYQHLRHSGVDVEWLQWLFPFGERRYAAELLMSQVCFKRSLAEILEAVGTIRTPAFRSFLESLDLECMLTSAEANLIRSSINKFLDQAVEDIAARAGVWVGISVVVTSIPATIWICRRLKQLRPELRLALGGPNFHRDNARQWLEAVPEIDAVFVGDSRLSLAEWVRDEAQSSPGLLVERGSQSTAIRHQPSSDRLPQDCRADWSDFDLMAYESSIIAPGTNYGDRPVIPIRGATGCSYNKCTFCYEVLLTARYIPRTVADVVDEVIYQRSRHETDLFFFTDLDFNGDYRRTLDLCDELSRRAPGIRFACWLRAHELDGEMLEALYSAGGRQFFVGLEAVTDHLLSLMEKGYDGAHARHVLGILDDFGRRRSDVVYGFNLISHYPGETLDDVRETLAFVNEHRELFRSHVAALFEFTLTTNTVVWKRRTQAGIQQVEGFGKVLLPPPLSDLLPSHRYWYVDESPDFATRTLLWDVLRSALGHVPRYLNLT